MLNVLESHRQSNHPSLGELTLVIPTLNRHSALKKTLAYWSTRGPQIVVLDGSPKPLSADFIASLGGNIVYLDGPSDFQLRLESVRDVLETEYVCLHGDDELHLPSALSRCIHTLSQHPDFVACIGWALGFRAGKRGSVFGYDAYPELREFELCSRDPLDRILEHMTPYRVPAHSYAVIRSPAYLRALDIVIENKKHFFAQGEYEFEIAIAAQGKTAVIPQVHWLRNFAPSKLRSTSPDTDPRWRLEDFWFDPSQAIERATFVQGLSSHFANVVGLDPMEFGKELERIFLAEATQKANQSRSASSSVRSLCRWGMQKLPPTLRNAIDRSRIGRRERRAKRHAISVERKARELENRGAEVNWNELHEALSVLQN